MPPSRSWSTPVKGEWALSDQRNVGPWMFVAAILIALLLATYLLG